MKQADKITSIQTSRIEQNGNKFSNSFPVYNDETWTQTPNNIASLEWKLSDCSTDLQLYFHAT